MEGSQIESILIIGGGASGLVTLRNLLEIGHFKKVSLYERRDQVGGVWHLDDGVSMDQKAPRWPSPAYPGLIGNVFPKYLQFHDTTFPRPHNDQCHL